MEEQEQEVDFNIDDEFDKLAKLAIDNTPGAAEKVALTKTIGVLSDEWFTLKKKLDDIKADQSDFKKRQEDIEEILKKLMKANDMQKITSKLGTISRAIKCMPSVKDLPTFVKWVSEDMDNRIGFMEKKVSSTAVNEYLEQNTNSKMLMDLLSDEDADFTVISEQLHKINALPPGVDAYMQVKLGKRKAANK